MRWLFIWFMTAIAASAEENKAGAFDYFVLSLSWSPNWCALEGDAQGSDQCDAGRKNGWIMHGLWPQYQSGYPEFCRTSQPPPTRTMTASMADIMGTSGLAWYQWKKHGVCSGLSATQYYDLSRRAYQAVVRPEVFRRLDRAVTLPASVVQDAFIQANPGLKPDMITITCKDGYIQEVRLCLTKDLDPVQCGRDVVRDCTAANALFTPIR